MKTLRLLNIAAVLLLFTPFFQMCSDDEGEAAIVETTPREDVADTSSVQSDESIADQSIDGRTDVDSGEKSFLERFWELITVPGDNFTTTAFGLFVITVLDISEGHFLDIWIGSVLTIASLLLTLSTLILLLKGRLNHIVRLLWINLFLILATFIAAIAAFDSISQVKWGYYAYLGTVGLLLFQARITVPLLQEPGLAPGTVK
jgi:hypothetical protein